MNVFQKELVSFENCLVKILRSELIFYKAKKLRTVTFHLLKIIIAKTCETIHKSLAHRFSAVRPTSAYSCSLLQSLLILVAFPIYLSVFWQPFTCLSSTQPTYRILYISLRASIRQVLRRRSTGENEKQLYVRYFSSDVQRSITSPVSHRKIQGVLDRLNFNFNDCSTVHGF